MIEEIEEGRVISFVPASLSAVGEEELESAGYAEGKASAAPFEARAVSSDLYISNRKL